MLGVILVLSKASLDGSLRSDNWFDFSDTGTLVGPCALDLKRSRLGLIAHAGLSRESVWRLSLLIRCPSPHALNATLIRGFLSSRVAIDDAIG